MECNCTRRVWFASSLNVCSLNKWLWMNRSMWLNRVLDMCYEKWKNRNKRCFEGYAFMVLRLVWCEHIILLQTQGNSSALILQSQTEGIPVPNSNVRWTPPSPGSGWFKLNIDAPGLVGDGSLGLSALICDADGVVVEANSCKKKMIWPRLWQWRLGCNLIGWCSF